ARPVRPPPPWGEALGGGLRQRTTAPPPPRRFAPPLPTRRSLSLAQWHHLPLHLHHRPPQRSRTTAEAAERGWRLNGFHFSGTGSAAWRGESASGAKSSTATAAATASAAAPSSFASASAIKPSCPPP